MVLLGGVVFLVKNVQIWGMGIHSEILANLPHIFNQKNPVVLMSKEKLSLYDLEPRGGGRASMSNSLNLSGITKDISNQGGVFR